VLRQRNKKKRKENLEVETKERTYLFPIRVFLVTLMCPPAGVGEWNMAVPCGGGMVVVVVVVARVGSKLRN
jgi:hypothetical protein